MAILNLCLKKFHSCLKTCISSKMDKHIKHRNMLICTKLSILIETLFAVQIQFLVLLRSNILVFYKIQDGIHNRTNPNLSHALYSLFEYCFTRYSYKVLQLLFSHMACKWTGRLQKKFACIKETIRCRKLKLCLDIGLWSKYASPWYDQ